MSNKARIYTLAKEWEVSNEEVIKILNEGGIKVTSSLASVEREIAENIHLETLEKDESKSEEKKPKEKKPKEKKPKEKKPKEKKPKEKKPKEKKPKEKKPKEKKPKEKKPKEKKPKEKKPKVAKKDSHPTKTDVASNEIHCRPPITVKTFAELLGIKVNSLIGELMMMNIFASINQKIDNNIALQIADKHGVKLVFDKREKHEAKKTELEMIAPEDAVFESKTEDLLARPPVVAFLGHVDHGKTSLQDAVRETDVIAGESGGITQHIGASVVEFEGNTITFIDTPGHEAFTAMRARGANTTDIAILVIAADDGLMPQTIEAINHVKAAGVPIIIAINKIDLPNADPGKILVQLQQHEIMTEEWGGEIGVVKVSAITKEGLDELLERILLESEMLELKFNPKLPAKATVIEGKLHQGLGVQANILITDGIIKSGDIVICGEHSGKIKALVDSNGKKVKVVPAGLPAQLFGLSGVPEAGAKLAVCDNAKLAKKLTAEREEINRQERLATPQQTSLENLFEEMAKADRKELNLIVKADVKGSLEAITHSLEKLSNEKITIKVIHSAVGSITENDILLASASDAIVTGFHVRVNSGVNKIAEDENVQLRLYSVIYELIEDVTEALEGKLDPSKREKAMGEATILEIFEITKGPKVCGSRVTKGLVRVGAKARVIRGKDVIYNGSIASLKRFQDSAKEVKSGFECGINLDNFNDFEVDDRIEVYEIIMEKATL